MSAPLTPPERMLAAFLHAFDVAAALDFAGFGDAMVTLRKMLWEARCDGWVNGWTLTDPGRSLVARWQAERERDIDVRAKAAFAAFVGANDGDGSWERLTTSAQSIWRAVVRAVDASRDGAP